MDKFLPIVMSRHFEFLAELLRLFEIPAENRNQRGFPGCADRLSMDACNIAAAGDADAELGSTDFPARAHITDEYLSSFHETFDTSLVKSSAPIRAHTPGAINFSSPLCR